MKIRTSIIHEATPLRIHAILKTLQREGHVITNEGDADIWFVDCIWPDKIEQSTIDELLIFEGKIVLMSLGDLNMFRLDHLPSQLIDKVSAFCKIQWARDLTVYDQRILSKMVTIHPFLIGNLPQPLIKKPKVCFFGLPTGAKDTEDNLRIRACRILKNQPWFTGGIVGQESYGIDPRDISGIEIGYRPRNFYLRTMNKSLLSLCMPGNSPLTYRMFESLGVGSAVVSCCLDDTKWLNRMEPGTHYFAVKPDLSDLLETCEQAIHNEVQTHKIAAAGYTLHQNYYAIQSDGGLSDNIWQDILAQFSSVGIIF